MTPLIVDATQAHALAMAPRLRRKDRDELEAAGWGDPAEALCAHVEASPVARAWLVEGQPACLYGVAGTLTASTGNPWLLSTEYVRIHWRMFARHSKRELARILALYPALENACDARYTESLRWLRWMGFEVGEPEALGPRGEWFCRFRSP